MKWFVTQCCCNRQHSVRRIPSAVRQGTVTFAALFLILQIAMSQEPVVVTTVRKPVTAEKKVDSVPEKKVQSLPARDTTAATEKKSAGVLDNLTPSSNSIISYDRISAGLGLGLDYGGIGANILMYPHRNAGFFLGLGYNFVKVGVNSGIKARVILGDSRNNIGLSALAMYGYNAAIGIKNYPELSKVFYGFSVGLGIDYRPLGGTDDYAFLGLYIPFRKPEVKEYIDNLKGSGVQFERELSPVLIAIGYRITIK